MGDSANRIDVLEAALRSIALNTCCGTCQEAALVAQKALGWKNCERCGKNHYDLSRPTVPTCPFKPQRTGPGETQCVDCPPADMPANERRCPHCPWRNAQ